MKILGRKFLRTCLSMLLVVACLLTSFLFFNIRANAQNEVVDTFYILDEEGNPVNIEVTQGDLMSDFQNNRRRTFTLTNDDMEIEPRTNVIGIVRFKSAINSNGEPDPTVDYTEVDTGRNGYFHCKSAGDAAYIRTESDGSVICKLSGVVMKVPAEYVKEIVSYQDQKISYYAIADNGYLIHNYTYYSGENLALASTRVGYKPAYLTSEVKYYSYDGHYFYTEFETMISDYQNNTYSNAVNADTPYYNYYQYLSLHTIAPFTADQYNAHVAEKKKESIMLTTGNGFVGAQNKYTINALLMFGVAINESGWGTSTISNTKNNLFGLNAVDSSPGLSADTFESVDACIEDFAFGWMHTGYLDGTDARYRGPHLGDKHSGINVKYASDPFWGEKAAARGYYLDTQNVDYGRYTIGVTLKGKVNFYKEADVTSTIIYTSEAGQGSKEKAYLYDFPVVVLETVTGVNGEIFYKVISDMSLKEDRSGRDVEAIYNADRDYVYVSANDIKIVFDGSGKDITIPEVTVPGKTHEEVITTLNVANVDNCLTGFPVGSDVATAIAKVNALDPKIQVVIKKADGTQITSGMVATGMKMTVTTNGSTVDYSIVIRGDVNGDGKLSAVDYVKLRNYLDKVSVLQDTYLKSADASGDGNISALDYVKLRNHLDGKSAIVQ